MAYVSYSGRGCVRFPAIRHVRDRRIRPCGVERARRQSCGVGLARSRSSWGRILVDSRGRTLYLFEKDKSRKSMCSGSCATLGATDFGPPFYAVSSAGAAVVR
jgi:predicted lipoprotein with Yx(FWY)xxD motif